MKESGHQAFGQLNLHDRLLRAIDDLGFEEPSPIQEKAIPVILEGRDVIGQAQTGTGKTAAFAIPIVQHLTGESRNPQALILTPTRELAIQVAEDITQLGKYTPLRILPIYGDQPIQRQIKALKSGVDVIIGTPGRLLDHIRRRTIHLDSLRTVVLDEADEMLNMGFIEEVESILRALPDGRQTLLFSATMPEPIVRLAGRYMKNPVRISIQPERITAPDIEHVYYEARPHERIDVMCRILDGETINRAIVFCRTKRGVDELTGHLRARGFLVGAIHGDLDQRQRNRVMQAFRDADIDLLIATDVAARGLDVENVTHVINFDIPTNPESYVHRIGRTGRAGKSGTAITLIHPKENKALKTIERLVKVRIKRRRVPTTAEVAERQREIWRAKLERTLEQNNLAPFRVVVEELTEEYDSIDVGAAALKLLMNEQQQSAQPPIREEFAQTGAEAGMVRFFINIGRKQGTTPADIVRSIAENSRIPGSVIGKIDLYDNFAFVEVPEETASTVAAAMRNGEIRGRSINIEPARPMQ